MSGTTPRAAPDGEALDRYEARLHELASRLDAKLIAVTAAFIEEHTGIGIDHAQPVKR